MQQIAFNYRYYERWEIRKTSPTISNQHWLFGTKRIRPNNPGLLGNNAGLLRNKRPLFCNKRSLFDNKSQLWSGMCHSDNLFYCLSFGVTLVSQKESSVFCLRKRCFPRQKTPFSNLIVTSYPYCIHKAVADGGR